MLNKKRDGAPIKWKALKITLNKKQHAAKRPICLVIFSMGCFFKFKTLTVKVLFSL